MGKKIDTEKSAKAELGRREDGDRDRDRDRDRERQRERERETDHLF